jgi:transposase
VVVKNFELSGGLTAMNKTKHRKLDRVKGNVLIVGVDVSKAKHVAGMRLPSGMVLKTLSFTNDLPGFEKLRQEVQRCCERYNLRGAILGIEPTGHYWEALAYWWEDQGGTVVLVNPMHTKKTKELEDNSPLKSDKKDGIVIADLVSQGKYFECHLPRGVFAELRNLVFERERCQNQRTQVINQLHQSVDRLFPEIATEFSGIRVKSYQRLLAKYPDPKELAAVPVEKLTKMLRKWSRGSLGEEKAQRLTAVAGRSVGVKEAASIIAAEVKRLIGLLEWIEKDSCKLEEQIENCLERTPGAAMLLSVPSFGPITVAGILANTGNLAEYEHPEEALKLAGLNLFEISSGKHKGRLRISKRGRAQLRKILFMAALRAARRDSPFRQYYQRLLDRRLEKTAALVALMRKLLRISWSLVRNSQMFDEQRLNQKQAA